MNVKGQIINVLPLMEAQAKKSWVCNTLCKVDDPILIDRYKEFHQAISTCTSKKISELLRKIHKGTIKDNSNMSWVIHIVVTLIRLFAKRCLFPFNYYHIFQR